MRSNVATRSRVTASSVSDPYLRATTRVMQGPPSLACSTTKTISRMAVDDIRAPKLGSKMRRMNAPDSRRRLSRKPRPTSKRRRSKAFLAEVRRQCRLANKADRRDNWQQYLYFPE